MPKAEELFQEIVGFEDLKAQMRFTLNGGPVVHWLLWGPPGTAKTLFLLDASRLPAAHYFLGSSTSKVGLAEVLVERQPRVVLIDEIEKMGRENMVCLLSLMETGLVSITKSRKHISCKLPKTRVLAAANTTGRLPPELMSRFFQVHIPPYDKGDFVRVVVRVLLKEGWTDEVAQAIAHRLWNVGVSDVRQARHVARLAAGDKGRVQETIDFLLRYR